MGEVMLPRSYSGEMHQKALDNLVKRYKETSEPVYYKKAAINMDDSTASKCLKFLWECGLLDRDKQAYYVPPSCLIDFVRGIGPTAEQGKEDVVERLKEDEIFNEVDILVRTNNLEKSSLAKNVAGQVGVDKDDIDRVERYIEIFIELEILEVSDEGEIEPNYGKSNREATGENKDAEKPEEKPSAAAENTEEAYQTRSESHRINLDVTMDITEMDKEEIEEKLALVNEELR